MKSAFERNRRRASVCLATAIVCGLFGPGPGALFAQNPAPDELTDWVIEPPFAWNRTDRYVPPDFEAFFPDDVEGGRQLDLMIEGKLTVESAGDRLAVVRRGLRNTSHYRTTLLGSVGNQFIWNQDEQDPRAIELMYHATLATDGGAAHYALYHGPTVVSDRTPNLVRMLMEQYQSLDGGMQRRIAWGMRTYGDLEQTRSLLLGLLDRWEDLDSGTIGAALDTYQAVFETEPPDMDRFDDVGQWVIAFHRTDLSADHPRAAEILRETLDAPFRGREDRLIDFVTRVDDGHETAVALIQGVGPRNDLTARLSRYVSYRIDFNEMLSPRILRENRLREFARHLPDGLPEYARPEYTRPPADATYAYSADEFVAPDFEAFFADDPEAGRELDEVYEHSGTLELSDRELLDLFRRGFRRSAQTPNMLFSWIASALGWPRDPLLTEILYQGVDPNAPPEVRQYAIYYGFGLGTEKTDNILEAMFRVYLAPPVDREMSSTRSRILWGVRDHEDDKHYLATRFEQTLRDHASLSDAALREADRAYRELTELEPPNAAEYASRGVYVVVCRDRDSRSIDESKRRMAQRFGESEHVIDTVFVEDDGEMTVIVAVQGMSGMNWLIDNLQAEPQMRIDFADVLTRELIDIAENDVLREFEKHLPGAGR